MPLDHYLTLGRSGLAVSPFCLGTMTFGEDWGWGASAEECRLVNTSKPEEEYFLVESTYDPVWSPDGKWLAYTRRDGSGQEFHQDWVVNVNQPEQSTLMGEWTFGPLWSPDGKWLAYQRNPAYLIDVEDAGSNEIWLYDLKNGKQLKTDLPPAARAVDW